MYRIQIHSFVFFSCLQQAEDGNQHEWYKKMYNTIHKVHEGGECIYEYFPFVLWDFTFGRRAIKERKSLILKHRVRASPARTNTDKGEGRWMEFFFYSIWMFKILNPLS